jgi:outer membrane biosynthesis protein TonB
MSAEPRAENVVERHQPIFVLAALGASLLLHGVAYASLTLAPAAAVSSNPTSEMAFEVAPPPPPRAAEPEPPPPAPRPIERVSLPRPAAAPPEPRQTPAPRSVAPVDLSGVTLSNDSGDASWASAAGNGGRMQGPLGPVAARRTPPAASAAPVRTASAPELVAAVDLSERPRPPALDSVLRRNFPEQAWSRGVSGSASVRARIEPDGRTRQLRVTSESFAGFGEACRRTLAGSRWSPPKDRQGNAVATEIAYTCRFVVDR